MTELLTSASGWPHRLAGGELIAARYRLKRVAGAGGMATVWLAHDERLERPVAIKVISDALAANPAAVARFAREARTHAGIQHPNLVQVYDYSITAAQPYLVMEYVNGCTLSERLDHGGFSAAEIPTLAHELLSAVACVHDHGVLHRDIKSANVLLDSEGHARLTDFGLARLEDSSHITHTDEIVGTLRFLAPELIEGRPASRQSDLFALGVVLRGAAGTCASQPQIAELIGRLTQQEPEDRPADAHAALALLTPPAHARQERTAALASRHGAAPRSAQPHPAAHRTAPLGKDPRTAPLGKDPRTAPLGKDPRTASPGGDPHTASGHTARRHEPGRRPGPGRTRSRARGPLRSRAAALSALVSAATATFVAIALGTGNGAPALAHHHTATRTRAGRVAYNRRARRAPTIDERLARLASSIRHAGSGR